SERLLVTVMRHGKQHDQEYRRGTPVAPVKASGKADSTGTYLRFWPDPEVFEELGFHWDIVSHRLRELAFLNKALTIVLHDERIDLEYTFYFEGGIGAFVKYLNRDKGWVNLRPCTLSARPTETPSRLRCSTTRVSPRASWPSPTTSIPWRVAAMSLGSARR